MSLVAYDYSSESENEDYRETETTSPMKIKFQTTNRETRKQLKSPVCVVNENLTEPSAKKTQNINKPKKLNEPTKIFICSLNKACSDGDVNDDVDPYNSEIQDKKIKNYNSPNDLFALLPAPKSTPLSNTSFVPQVLQKKVTPSTFPKARRLKKLVTPAKHSTVSNSNDEFGIPETFDDETWQKVCGRRQHKSTFIAQGQALTTSSKATNFVDLAPHVEKPYTGLDNQAFKDLIHKGKGLKGNIKLIDIREDELCVERKEWLKSLTDPSCEPETAIAEPVNNTCRIKNHITSLAQKALANDLELQMKWSENRHNRRQTQAKYGF